jgi:hypothetical protein
LFAQRSRFYRAGHGTLAPWDPPRQLVAVALIHIRWAGAFSSGDHRDGPDALWLYGALVAVAFHVRVVLSEEPFLERTHGEDWARCRTQLRRWL